MILDCWINPDFDLILEPDLQQTMNIINEWNEAKWNWNEINHINETSQWNQYKVESSLFWTEHVVGLHYIALLLERLELFTHNVFLYCEHATLKIHRRQRLCSLVNKWIDQSDWSYRSCIGTKVAPHDVNMATTNSLPVGLGIYWSVYWFWMHLAYFAV